VRQSLSSAETALREAEDKLKNAQRDLEDIFKPEKFGKNGEWKKLDGLCLEKDTGEYVLLLTTT
jgi:protein kinase C substrate 80K-H